MMEVEARQAVEGEAGARGDELLLGRASWNDEDTSLKYGWHDKNGKLARGGELPAWAIPQAVGFAATEGFLERDQMAAIAKAMVDALAGPAPALS